LNFERGDAPPRFRKGGTQQSFKQSSLKRIASIGPGILPRETPSGIPAHIKDGGRLAFHSRVRWLPARLVSDQVLANNGCELLVFQGNHGIDAHRAACRDVASQQCDQDEHDCHAEERQQIGWFHAVEQAR